MSATLMPASGRFQRQTSDGLCLICKQATSGKKPYCIDHMEYLPRVKELLSSLSQKEKEEKLVLKRGLSAIKEDSLVLSEIIDILSLGSKTVGALAKEVSLKESLVRIYIKYLSNKNTIRMQPAIGGDILHLISQDN